MSAILFKVTFMRAGAKTTTRRAFFFIGIVTAIILTIAYHSFINTMVVITSECPLRTFFYIETYDQKMIIFPLILPNKKEK